MVSKEAGYSAPVRLAAVYETLADEQQSVRLIAGGMSLMPLLNRGMGERDNLLSLGRVKGLDRIEVVDGALHVGATATHAQLSDNILVRRHAPILGQAAGGIGDVQVRNRGTIGGVVAYGNAGADYLSVLPALDATVVLGSTAGERRSKILDFVLGLRHTDLAGDEVVIRVEIPIADRTSTAFRRYFRVQGAAPTITAAVSATTESLRLVVGGAAPRPVLVESRKPAGDAWDVDGLIAELDRRMASTPFGDAHNPAPYRRAMGAVFARRVLADLSGKA